MLTHQTSHPSMQLYSCCALQVLSVRHLALRVRDHLLAYAHVSPICMEPSHGLLLASHFIHLRSLSLSGKLLLGQDFMMQLLTGLTGLKALSLDGHMHLTDEARRGFSNLKSLQVQIARWHLNWQQLFLILLLSTLVIGTKVQSVCSSGWRTAGPSTVSGTLKSTAAA